MKAIAQPETVWPWVEPLSNGSNSANGTWPRISVVTPNYNYGDLIEMTMRSVLMQGYPNLEYIVIDDGSKDHSLEVIKNYERRLAYFEQHPNQGQYSTLNKGFLKATGEICGWINSDDILLPWTLRTVAAIFSQFPKVEWIIGIPAGIQDGVVHSIKQLKPFPREMIRAGLFHGGEGGFGWIQQESCFWRRSLWEKVGGLRTEFRYAADFELWTRFAQHADLYAVSTLLGGFTHRRGENRSVANRDRYVEEVAQASAQLRSDPRSPESKLARRLDRALAIRRKRGLGYLGRRMFPLRDLCGPVLKWDFKDSRYDLRQKSFF
jgi:glycosyltransferase involved in cell wall biosynthesis